MITPNFMSWSVKYLPGEMTALGSLMSNAAMLPMANPYPEWMSGSPTERPTMPGRAATLAICLTPANFKREIERLRNGVQKTCPTSIEKWENKQLKKSKLKTETITRRAVLEVMGARAQIVQNFSERYQICIEKIFWKKVLTLTQIYIITSQKGSLMEGAGPG